MRSEQGARNSKGRRGGRGGGCRKKERGRQAERAVEKTGKGREDDRRKREAQRVAETRREANVGPREGEGWCAAVEKGGGGGGREKASK